MTSTLLLAAITTGLIIATMMTGGGAPFVYCLVVSSFLMTTQLIALVWTAKRIAQQRTALKARRKSLLTEKVEADRRVPRRGIPLTEYGSEWKSCKEFDPKELAALEIEGLDEEGFDEDPEPLALEWVASSVNAWLADIGDFYGKEGVLTPSLP